MRHANNVFLSVVFVAVVAAGCSSGQQTSSTSEPDATSETTSDDGTGPDSVSGATSDDSELASPTLVPQTTSAGIAMDERYVALANLDAEAFCAHAPLAELEAAIGTPITADPVASSVVGVSTDCAWYSDDAGSFITVAALRISPYAWSFVESTIGMGDPDGAPEPVECVIADLPAICQDGYDDNGLIVASNVHVQLGSDADYALYAASELGLDQAKAVATLAVSNIAN